MNVEVVVRGGLGELALSTLQLQDVRALAATRLLVAEHDLTAVLARITSAGLAVVAVAEQGDPPLDRWEPAAEHLRVLLRAAEGD